MVASCVFNIDSNRLVLKERMWIVDGQGKIVSMNLYELNRIVPFVGLKPGEWFFVGIRQPVETGFVLDVDKSFESSTLYIGATTSIANCYDKSLQVGH